MGTELEDRMVDYALTLRFKDLPASVVHHAKRRMVDTLASAFGAYSAPPVQIARKIAVPVSGPFTARIWGSLQRTTPELAAFANGTMLRYLDINDTYGSPFGTHPSDYISALFALAEALNKSGADLIEAMVISYEIQCRFVDSVPFSAEGFDQAVVPGILGAALGVGRLFGFGREAMRDCLALTITPNLSSFQARAGSELSMWKGCAAANGARQAIFAGVLANEGMDGPYDFFEGKYGVWKLTMGKPQEVRPFATPTNGVPFGIAESFLKQHPVRFSCQIPVETAKHLYKKVVPSEIEEVIVETSQDAYDRAATNPQFWDPQTRETADHSLPVMVAMTLVDGEVEPNSFNRGRYRAPEVLAMLKKVKVVVNDDFTKVAPRAAEDGVRHCRITAKTRSGEAKSTHLQWTTDELKQGMTDAQLEEKFERLSIDVMTDKNRRDLLDLLWKLDKVGDVTEVVDRLAV
jgi:2-methylcitrate dehydratase